MEECINDSIRRRKISAEVWDGAGCTVEGWSECEFNVIEECIKGTDLNRQNLPAIGRKQIVRDD